MYDDDDTDALAAEYVLGTLSGDEREQAEALISLDPDFEAAVRQWERRLGELNVMVEAVEPPPQVWDDIKTAIAPEAVAENAAAPADLVELPEFEETALEVEGPAKPQEEPTIGPAGELEGDLEGDLESDLQRELDGDLEMEPVAGLEAVPEAALGTEPQMHDAHYVHEEMPAAEEFSPVAALASSLGEGGARHGRRPIAEPGEDTARSAEVIRLSRRARRWRRRALAVGTIAALLAVYVALEWAAPDVLPPELQPFGAEVASEQPATAPLPHDRLVAVLQHEPTAPAFLVTLDAHERTLIVRRVAAKPEPGRSYELWLISKRFPAPRSLGLVGTDEFTRRSLPGDYDFDTLRAASYAVSLEPAGGAPHGVPTGPVLFTGNAVESLPAPSQPAPPSRT